jgi:hypothetical protein
LIQAKNGWYVICDANNNSLRLTENSQEASPFKVNYSANFTRCRLRCGDNLHFTVSQQYRPHLSPQENDAGGLIHLRPAGAGFWVFETIFKKPGSESTPLNLRANKTRKLLQLHENTRDSEKFRFVRVSPAANPYSGWMIRLHDSNATLVRVIEQTQGGANSVGGGGAAAAAVAQVSATFKVDLEGNDISEFTLEPAEGAEGLYSIMVRPGGSINIGGQTAFAIVELAPQRIMLVTNNGERIGRNPGNGRLELVKGRQEWNSTFVVNLT